MKKTIFTSLLLSFGLFVSTPVSALAATLSLSPANGTFNQGCNFSVNINLDTQGTQTDGTDAIVLYDSTKFTATTIQNGTIYSDYPGSNIDPQSGKITVSGLASVSQPFTGSGTLATINFQVVSGASVGSTQLTFDFDPNNKTKTTDSNVVERGTVVDVLSSVTNGSYVVGSGSCTSQASPVPGGGTLTGGTGGTTSTNSATPTKSLPSAGSETLTFTLAILGSVLAILGVLGLAIL